MKLFKKLLNSEKEESAPFPWILMDQGSDLGDIVEKSEGRPQLIFKHSTSCGLSAMILRRFEKEHRANTEGVDFYLLDLWRYRALSDHVAKQFGVRHQSPQLILIKNGGMAAAASHSEILHQPLHLGQD